MEDLLISKLCDYIVDTVEPTSTRWGWGEGLLAYAFIKYDLHTNKEKHLNYAKKYVDYYVENIPDFDCSDRTVPSLAALELYKITKDEKYLKLVNLASEYAKNCEKILDNTPNHFGTSKKESSYPASIWVDSLMMYTYFVSVYGSFNNNNDYLDDAYNQIITFYKHLRNSKTKLWHHAYWVKEKLQYPKGNMFWGRGNGWVALSLALVYENLTNAKQKEEVKAIYKESIDAILKYQKRDGSFKTLLMHPETVKETSATALIAAGIYKAISLNILDDSYKHKADKAYTYCIKNIKETKDGIFFRKISGSTVPLEKHPYYWYITRKEKINANYGIYAIVMATIFKN